MSLSLITRFQRGAGRRTIVQVSERFVEPLDCSDACVQIAMRLVGELVGGLRFAPFSALGLAASTFGAYQEPPAPGLSADRGWVAQEFPVTGSTRGAIFEFMCSEVMLACAEAGVSAVATVFLPKTRGTGIRLGSKMHLQAECRLGS